jgi:hypothetical protein
LITLEPDHAVPELDVRELRKFGFTTAGIVAMLFGLGFPWLLGRDWPIWPWIVLALLAVPALLAPAALRPVYRGWMKFGALASKVTTPLLFGLVFFLVICPTGMIRGAAGKNVMRRPFRGAVASYRLPSRRKPAVTLKRPY